MKSIKLLKNDLESRIKTISDERDQLRLLEDEIRDHCDNIDEAIELFEEALDKLSELL